MANSALRPRDVSDLKGRIAEAFVEAIFRHAGYRVSRAGREANVQRLGKVGAGEFLPDFVVWKSVPSSAAERFLRRMLNVEVKYRVDLQRFLSRECATLVATVKPQWPDLLFVLVTDHPDPDRSCFQVIDVATCGDGVPRTTDLHRVAELDIYPTTVEEYEGLVKEIFPLFG